MTHGTTDLTADVPLDEIRALVDERGRYESWLATLESRRSATAEHVYVRVRDDYGSRLQRVLLALASHVEPLQGAEGALTSRQHELTSTLSTRHDELAEAELRTAVGEYTPEEGDRLRREKEEDIGRLDESLQDVTEELGQVRELLRRAQSDLTAGHAAAPSGASGADESELPAAPDEDAMPDHPPGMMRPTPSIGSFLIEEQAAQGGSAAAPAQPPRTSDSGSPSFEDLSLMTSGSASSGTAPAQGGSAGGTRGSFDTPSSASSSPDSTRPFAPLAGELASPAAKTLRCQECGTMNFPTEWYCERCGGELAAL